MDKIFLCSRTLYDKDLLDKTKQIIDLKEKIKRIEEENMVLKKKIKQIDDELEKETQENYENEILRAL